MDNHFSSGYNIDYVEIYTPMAKVLAYWHSQALGFTEVAYAGADTGKPGVSSYVLESGGIRLVLTSSYPMNQADSGNEVSSFILKNYCGVKRIALQVDDVKAVFEKSISNGAIPVKVPSALEDGTGWFEEAAIKLYDDNEIVFVNRRHYEGAFKPGYKAIRSNDNSRSQPLFWDIDHVASEVRVNESSFWTIYLSNTIGVSLVQSIQPGEGNITGMILKVNQSVDRQLTFVIAEPETCLGRSKVQRNIDAYGPGIHHLAFTTNDIHATTKKLADNKVEFVAFPASYYDLLRENDDFKGMDIDALEQRGIIIDKEGETFLLQKFIRPISDRPFFFYEIVQRVNGYEGFALKNINVLKKAEEIDIMKLEKI